MDNLNIPSSNLKRVVIIGGGFAGINMAKKLRKNDFQIVMLDKHNYHTFIPLLYQVATAGLEPDSIAQPLRQIFIKHPHFYFRLAQARKVDAKNQRLETNIGSLEYDYLVIATGSTSNYFGIENIRKMGLTMKTVPEALNLRSIILQNFEEASLTNDLKERERLMNFVIVGAGPTGVELAGALAELKTHVLPRDYPDLDFRRMSIHLLEAADKILPPMSESASKHALQDLKELGVQVWLHTMVKDYDGQNVITNGKELQASTLIWAAGVKGAILNGLDGNTAIKSDRFVVDAYNRVNGHSNIFALGDVAGMYSEKTPKGHPMLAQVAIQQAVNLAGNLNKESEAQWQPFHYKDLGAMATIGRNRAVADLKGAKLHGFWGWWVWMLVHLISLVGFRNKLVVLLNWFVNYFSYDRKIRLIIRPVHRKNHKVAPTTAKS